MNTEALPLFASAYPLRAIGNAVWTRHDDTPGSRNNFIFATCDNEQDAALVAHSVNQQRAMREFLKRLTSWKDIEENMLVPIRAELIRQASELLNP
jgi:hypothetical protein